jgi:TolB-like protein/DNA-binding CsgD family transcriptional regulator
MEAGRLSRRETEIATAYARGATYRAIAERLGIAPTTVRAHISTVYRKLGVGSKIELLTALGGPGGVGPEIAAPAAPVSAGAERPTVAILPFENRSGASEHEGIIAGLVDATTGSLSKFRMLTVISAASSLGYRDSGKDLRDIAAELGARYLLRGSFFRDDARMRVTTELVDTATFGHVWSKTYDGAWSSIFEVQDDLSASIAQAIEPEIRVREFERARRGKARSVTAWELYCNGFDAAYRFSEAGYRQARDHAMKAIAADDTFAAPHQLLCRIDLMETVLAISRDPARSLSEGIAHGRRALELDPRDEVAHCPLSCCLVLSGAFDEALTVIDRAFEINANSAEVHNARALVNVLAPNGNLPLVISDSETALRMSANDPMRWTFLSNIGLAHLADEEIDSDRAALDAFRAASLLPLVSWPAQAGAALAALAIGEPREFEQQLARLRSARPGVTRQDLEQAFGHLRSRAPRVHGLIEQLAARLAG